MVVFISTLKKLLAKMGFISNKVVTGAEAKEKLAKEQLVSSALTDKEIQFILTKLRQANYTGAEFEFFSTVFLKLTNLLNRK